jgi:hypothetical protein
MSAAQPQAIYNTTNVRYVNPPTPVFIRPAPVVVPRYFPQPMNTVRHY